MADEKKFKILVVDDDDIIRETYLQVFRERGFETAGAKDGIEGVDLATKEKFDAILTGIIMPRMDGFQLISTLRESVQTKDIPVAIISHLGREEDRRKAKELGIDDFIVQGSMTPREVADRMKNLVSKGAAFKLDFDYSARDASTLTQKMNLSNFECPSCQNKLFLELTPKFEGKGFDAFLRCPKCGLSL